MALPVRCRRRTGASRGPTPGTRALTIRRMPWASTTRSSELPDRPSWRPSGARSTAPASARRQPPAVVIAGPSGVPRPAGRWWRRPSRRCNRRVGRDRLAVGAQEVDHPCDHAWSRSPARASQRSAQPLRTVSIDRVVLMRYVPLHALRRARPRRPRRTVPPTLGPGSLHAVGRLNAKLLADGADEVGLDLAMPW